MVRKRGLEPPRPCGHGSLNVVLSRKPRGILAPRCVKKRQETPRLCSIPPRAGRPLEVPPSCGDVEPAPRTFARGESVNLASINEVAEKALVDTTYADDAFDDLQDDCDHAESDDDIAEAE